MTAKEYLKQYRSIAAEIVQRRIIVKRMKSEIFGGPTDRVTAGMEAVGGKTMAMATWNTEDLASYQKQIEEQEQTISEFRKYMANVVRQISSLESSDFRIILFGKYIVLLTWEEISASLNLAEEYTRKEMHQAALQAFTEKFFYEFYKVPPKSPKNPAS